MADWTDHLTQPEAQAIVDIIDAPPKPGSEPKTRFEGRNDRGEKVTRYSRPTKAEMDRIRAKAQG